MTLATALASLRQQWPSQTNESRVPTMGSTTNLHIFRPPTPAANVLRERAISCLLELKASNDIRFPLAYRLAVGAPCLDSKTPDNLTPAECEAVLDLTLAMQGWRETGDVRPPQDHLEVIACLSRLGGRNSFVCGHLTAQGRKIVERYDAEAEARAIRSH